MSPSPSALPQAASATAYRLLKRHLPGAYLRVARWRGADFHPVTPDTDLVIAGVPGSANSFLRAAILIDNPQLRISSHAHVWTEVRDAVRWKRPVVLLVREPLSAAASRISRFGNATAEEALRDYADYHERVRRWADDVVVARFEDATRRPGDVQRRLNRRFGLELRPFPHDDPATLDELHELLREANGAVPTGHRIDAAEREAKLMAVHDAIRAPQLEDLRRRCLAVHEELTSSRYADRDS